MNEVPLPFGKNKGESGHDHNLKTISRLDHVNDDCPCLQMSVCMENMEMYGEHEMYGELIVSLKG